MAATATTASSSPHGPAASDDKIRPKLLRQLAERETTDFWIYFGAKADLSKASSIKKWDKRGTAVANELQQTAETSQSEVVEELRAAGVKYQSFWATNAIKVDDGDRELARRLASLRSVDSLWPSFKVVPPQPEQGENLHEVNAVEWGIANVNADDVWNEHGVRGEGIVIASIDTGVQYDHPALVDSYRGNNGDGTFDHNYNWFDAAGNCADAPCDFEGHGTHTMGTMVGDDGAGNQIGVAPKATWITANGCCPSDAALIASGEWMLEPTDQNGDNPDAGKRPDIINNSWGSQLPSTAPFMEDISLAWEASGIFGAWANGNSGEFGCNSSGSPGSRIINYSAGAYDINNDIASFSGRGAGQDGEIKPNLAAPGVNVRSSVPGDGYQSFSGTSMAAPHMAGAIALLWSASPSLRGEIQATKDLLDGTATDHPDDECGGTDDDNNVFGEGQLDALVLVNAAPTETGTLSGTVTDSGTGEPIAGAEITATGEMVRTVTTGADGSYEVLLPAGDYEVAASAFGYTDQTVTATITADQTTTQDFALAAVPRVRLGGSVTDGSGHGWPMYARITVDGVPNGVVHTNPVNGRYSISLPAGSTYQLTIDPRYDGYQTLTHQVDIGSTNTTHDVAVPVEASCTASGYEFSPIAKTYEQDFNTGAVPDGWTVVDHLGNGQVWTFDDPGSRGNQTGGDGAFAVVDSDEYGFSGEQDTSLVTPTLDFSDVPSPVIGFQQDYNNNFADFADVDVSVDGGETWQRLLRQNADVDGPDEQVLSAPQAGGEESVQFRFHYHNANYEWWWMVDDVFVGNRTCDPVNAGLVVGEVSDANTDAGVTGATVTNDATGLTATTEATPADPALGDGFYWMVSTDTGARSFTASAEEYVADSASIDVETDWVTDADFVFDAGMLTAAPQSLDANLLMDQETSRTFTVTNEGTAPAQIEFGTGGGDFEMLGGSAGDASALRYTDEAAEAAQLASDATASQADGSAIGDGEGMGWSRANGAGSEPGRSVTPSLPKTPADSVTITHSVSQEIIQFNSVSCNSGAGNAENGFLRTFNLEDFDITSDFNVTSVSFGVESATATQPIAVNLYTLDGEFVYENMTLIGSTETTLQAQELSMVSVPVEGSAPAGSTLVVELDSPNLQDIGAFFFPGSNDLGQTAPTYLRSETCGVAEPTPTGDLGFPGMHLVMNVTGETGAAVPWLSLNQETATLAPGQSVQVRATMDAAVDQPGTYTARINIAEDTPYSLEPIGVTMNVTPPGTWGKLVGVVSGTECDGASGPLDEATVQIDWWSGDLTLYTDEDGRYAYWLDTRGNPYSLILAKDGYKPKADTVQIYSGETVTSNYNLQKARC